MRTRSVECRATRQNLYVTFPDEFCMNETRPATNESCTRVDPKCESCQWEEGPWSEVRAWISVDVATSVALVLIDSYSAFCQLVIQSASQLVS